jgi:hypothetical protein
LSTPGITQPGHRQRCAKQQPIELTALAVLARISRQFVQHARLLDKHHHKGRDHQQQPQQLCPHLKLADHGDAVGDQGQHHQRANQITPSGWNAEHQLQRIGHDGRFQREKDEGETRVNE